MNDAVAILRERFARAEAKLQSAEKALEVAQAEFDDLQTALRVMLDITGETGPAQASPAMSLATSRRLEIVEMLGLGPENRRSPADLHEIYVGTSGEDVSISTFRTVMWRMADQAFTHDGILWNVHRENGKYWKVPAPDVSNERDAMPSQVIDENEPRIVQAENSAAAGEGTAT